MAEGALADLGKVKDHGGAFRRSPVTFERYYAGEHRFSPRRRIARTDSSTGCSPSPGRPCAPGRGNRTRNNQA